MRNERIVAITPCAPGWHVAEPVYELLDAPFEQMVFYAIACWALVEVREQDGLISDEILPVCIGDGCEWMEPHAATPGRKICEPGTTPEQALAWYLAEQAHGE